MKSITFIRNADYVYPRNDDDYELLRQEKFPTNTLTIDYFKTLEVYLKTKDFKINILHFDSVHKEMLRSLRDKYNLNILKTTNGLKITGEPISLKSLNALKEKLHKWYKLHYYLVDIQPKLTTKSFSLTIVLGKINIS